MAFGDIIQSASGFGADPITLPLGVTAGNSLVFMAVFRTFEGGAPSSVVDNVNSGSYSLEFFAGDGATTPGNPSVYCYFLSNALAGSAVITTTGTEAYRWVLAEIEGAIESSAVGALGTSYTAVSSLSTGTDTIPANAVSIGLASLDAVSRTISPAGWSPLLSQSAFRTFTRFDATESVGADFSSAISGGTSAYAAGWATFVEVTTNPVLRKGGAVTIDKPAGIGTITGVTLNGNAITLDAQDATTFTVTDSDGTIATSGLYDLVATGDTVETISVQVNVVGVAPSNNPVEKDGAAQASLTGVEVRVTDGAALNGAELYYTATATTDASGNLSSIDLSSTAVVEGDPVVLTIRTSAGDGLPSDETVGLI